MKRFFLVLACILPLPHFAISQLPGFKAEGDRWTYERDETKLQGVLLKPEGDGPFPAVVISHGLGGNAQRFARVAAQDFLKAGYVCIATNYTHHTEAVRARREAAPAPDAGNARPVRRGRQHPPDYGASPENVKRAMTCVSILESLPYVDKKRIAAYGHSMGAFLTIALAAEAPDRIRAAAITAGGIVPRSGFPAPTTDVAEKIRSPFLALHGSTDTTVRPELSKALEEVLNRNKVPNQRVVMDGVSHNIIQARREECAKLILGWFATHGLVPKSDTTDK